MIRYGTQMFDFELNSYFYKAILKFFFSKLSTSYLIVISVY